MLRPLTTIPMSSGVRVSPAARRLAAMTNTIDAPGTHRSTRRRKRTVSATTGGATRKKPTSGHANTMTGTTTAAEITAAATTDCRSVSSAGRRSPAPTCRATMASVPVPKANSVTLTAFRICTPIPDPGDRGGAQVTDHQEVAQPCDGVESEGDDRWPRQRPRGA